MPRQCEDCAKIFAHRQSLFRHKKKCKGSSVHVPMPTSYQKVSSENNSSKLRRIFEAIEDADDKASPDTDDGSVNNHKMDENSSEEEEFEDKEEQYDHQLWILLHIKCFKYNLSIYECMFRTLTQYFALEKDEPYQQIMEDVEQKEKEGLSFVDALDYAIEKNQDFIEEVVAEYRDKPLHWRDEPMNVWRTISIPSKYRCDWFTKTTCRCKRNTCSILKTFCSFVLTMHALEIEDLMQDLIEAVRNRDNDVTQDDALDMELRSREEAILSKFKEAKDRMDKDGYDSEYMQNYLQKEK